MSHLHAKFEFAYIFRPTKCSLVVLSTSLLTGKFQLEKWLSLHFQLPIFAMQVLAKDVLIYLMVGTNVPSIFMFSLRFTAAIFLD